MNNYKDVFKGISFSKESIIKIVYQLAMGMLGAILILLVLHIYEPMPRIGTVNITGIVDQFVKSQAKEKLPATELKKRIEVFSTKLAQTMHVLSSKQNIVLMPAEAVIAGATDYTPTVQKYLSQQ